MARVSLTGCVCGQAGCTADLKALVAHVGTEAKYKAVHKKFAHHKYKEVATLPGLAALA